MSGPPFPRAVAGSNAIGRFQIGVSQVGQIGTISPFDIWDTIISQYANSPTLTRLLADFAEYLDPTKLTDDFFDAIFNIDTAVGYGLDVWGRRVGVTRTLTTSPTTYFGFAQQAPGVDDFGPGGGSPLYSGQPVTSNFDLTDAAFKVLILAKALSNISDGSIPSINQLMLNLFPHRGNCYVTDGGNMTMTYTFRFRLSQVEAAIVASSGVLPKPAGVSATVVQLV